MNESGRQRVVSKILWGLFALAAVLLFLDHRQHVLGVLPYVLVLACPLMHLFMHRGHHGGHGHRQGDGTPTTTKDSRPEDR